MQFEEICRENYAGIYNYILAKTGNREAAEDITQDVFLIAFQKGGAFLTHEKPVAFLYATAKNLVLEYYKRSKYAFAKTAGFEETDITAFEKNAFEADAYEALCRQKSGNINEILYRKQVLRKLKPKERELYRKYYVDKKPMKAIARELQMSEPAVRMKYMRIRKKVQKIVTSLKLDDF